MHGQVKYYVDISTFIHAHAGMHVVLPMHACAPWTVQRDLCLDQTITHPKCGLLEINNFVEIEFIDRC